jgi:hypothetical protein
MEELESTLVDSLSQLERFSPGTPGGVSHNPYMMTVTGACMEHADNIMASIAEAVSRLWVSLTIFVYLTCPAAFDKTD